MKFFLFLIKGKNIFKSENRVVNKEISKYIKKRFLDTIKMKVPKGKILLVFWTFVSIGYCSASAKTKSLTDKYDDGDLDTVVVEGDLVKNFLKPF